ncbi:MAG: hypothetical protein H0V39_06035 [Nitrosomonas sp.]|nr:hypothetical protein [Nitrosomonas sp.]
MAELPPSKKNFSSFIQIRFAMFPSLVLAFKKNDLLPLSEKFPDLLWHYSHTVMKKGKNSIMMA